MDDQSPAQSEESGITFWGAAGTVSGSMHLVEAAGRRILLDCGLTQGRAEFARQRNQQFPFHPHQVDAVVLSHAHVDHCGNLPTLVRQGFRGPVYCTPATRDLVGVMLEDSARIQEEEAAHLNIQRQYRTPWLEPLYTQADAVAACDLLVPTPCGRRTEIAPGIVLSLHEAGHIIGSAMTHLEFSGGDALTYTGDLGRRGAPILQPAAHLPPARLVVCESTYGGRIHEPIEETSSRLAEVVRGTHERGGKVLIPAFSLGRMQLVVHFLCDALRAGAIPEIPIWIDSPLAAEVADVYQRHPEALDDATARQLRVDPDFLGGPLVRYVRSFEESLTLSERPGPAIIVAASGMCEAGRIVHHLKKHIDDPRCSVVLVSYQGRGTPGRQMLEMLPTVRLHGRDWNKWAEVVHLQGFSGHADQEDFRAALAPLHGIAERICLVHGEPDQAEALAECLRADGFPEILIPEPGERVPLRSPRSRP